MNEINEKTTAKNSIIEYLDIFWTMFKIGICTFGGGYAMIAILERELAKRRKWVSQEELLDYVAIGQITPGIIAVNMATFVGRKKKGILGAIVATLGVVTPSVIIIMIIAAFLVNFQDNEYVQHAFAGIRVCVCALIINAVIGFIKKTVTDLLSLAIFVCIFILAVFTRIETVYFVLGVIAVSVVLTLIFGERFISPDRKIPPKAAEVRNAAAENAENDVVKNAENVAENKDAAKQPVNDAAEVITKDLAKGKTDNAAEVKNEAAAQEETPYSSENKSGASKEGR